MHIDKLSLVNFKNYSDCSIDFHPKLNCFVGDNGVGKTNLLDAIYYLCMCKSYFNSSDQYNFTYETNFLVIQANFMVNDAEHEIYCGIKQGKKKQFRKNKKEYQRLSDHVGSYPVVMVSPHDSSLILDGSEERRKYMNGVISQYDRDYLEKTIQYTKVLQQRNKFLKESSPHSLMRDLLDVYNEQLIPLAESIHQGRQRFIEDLTPVFQKYYKEISQDRETVELSYSSQLSNENYAELLASATQKDAIIQNTSVGVHKDDLLLTMHNNSIKKVASQGQQKTFLVALKLAQFEFLANIKKVKPLLLLDDIFDKFDANRVKQILNLVSGSMFGQIFITHHNAERMRTLLEDYKNDYAMFEISNGNALKLEK